MSSRGSHRIAVARHVYLRTQQHRLRHVKSIVIRNLSPLEVNPDLFGDPLSTATYFTVHSLHFPEKVLYQSDPVQESYNPSWESVQFTPEEYEKYAAIPSFILKVWIKVGKDNQMMLAFEKTVKLASLVYLGTLVNKDGSSYPPNSVIVGMFEGYYSHPGVGGVPCPPRITHALEKLLPPQSLLEVHKTEVQDSYVHATLLRILSKQEMTNRATADARQAHNHVETLVTVEETYFKKRSERELLKMRVAILRKQLAEKEKEEAEERRQLCKLQQELDKQENTLSEGLADLTQRREKFELEHSDYCKRKDMLIRAKRNQLLRQRNMICEAAHTFFIVEQRDKYTICNVILQNSDQLDQPSSVEQPGVALGYVAHLVHHLAKILLVPLQYEIRPNGSRSHICDYISDEAIIDNIREFPLFMKGTERALFHYAVHLMNKNIAQIRQHCGYGVSKSMQKRTLPNLKYLLDKIIKELSAQPSTPRLDSSSISLQSATPTDSLVVISPMAVPPGRNKKMRERGGTSSTSSPSAGLTPPSRISFSTEQDVYSNSLSSPMSFQQSEDGMSRSLSPLQLQSQSSQDDTSSEQSFQSRFQFPPQLQQNTTSNNSSTTSQQYPTMQSDVQGRYYPKPIPHKSQESSFPILSPVFSIGEDLPSSPKAQNGVSLHQHTPEQSPSPKNQNSITSQSFAHADLHRSKLIMPVDDNEEKTSGGMLVDNKWSSESSGSVRIRSNALVEANRPPVILESSNEFVVGTGSIASNSSVEHLSAATNAVDSASTKKEAIPNELGGVSNCISVDPPHIQRGQDVESRQPEELSSHTNSQGDSKEKIPKSHPNNHPVNSITSTVDTSAMNLLSGIAASQSKTVDSASYQHALIETGYIKTVVATPHMVVRTEEDTGNRQPHPKPLVRTAPSWSQPNSSVSKPAVMRKSRADSQAELLEDFIDGF